MTRFTKKTVVERVGLPADGELVLLSVFPVGVQDAGISLFDGVEIASSPVKTS